MSVARAEARLATALLVELLAVIAEEDDRGADQPVAPTLVIAVAEPVADAA